MKQRFKFTMDINLGHLVTLAVVLVHVIISWANLSNIPATMAVLDHKIDKMINQIEDLRMRAVLWDNHIQNDHILKPSDMDDYLKNH